MRARVRAAAATRVADARSGASGFSQKTGRPASTASSTASRCAAVHVHTHTTSTLVEQLGERGRRFAAVVARRPAPRGRDRRRSVAVRRGVDEPGLGELLQHVRVHGADVPAPDQPDAHHRVLPHVVGRPASPAAPNASRSGRAPRRPRARPRPGARRGRRPRRSRRRARARLARRRCASSCDSDTPRSRTPRSTVEVRRAARVPSPGTTVLTSVASGIVRDRVVVSKSPKRIFSVSGPRLHPGAPQPACSRGRRGARARGRRRRASCRSTANVSSAPIDFASRSGTTSRGSSLRASACSRCPSDVPERRDEHRLRQRGDLADRVHPHALEPLQRRRARRPTGATPAAARGTRARCRARPTSRPSGFARSLASLARNFVVATPTDTHEPGLVDAPVAARARRSRRRCRAAAARRARRGRLRRSRAARRAA